MCRGRERYPAFTPNPLLLLLASQKWQLGFWSFCISLSLICPYCSGCRQLFLFTCSFFVFFLWRSPGDICPDAITAAKHPRSQPVCLFMFARSWFGFSFSTPHFYPENSFLKSTECWFLPLGRTPLTRSSVPLSLCLILALCSC